MPGEYKNFCGFRPLEKTVSQIESLQDANLDILCHRLSKLAVNLTTAKQWPVEQLAICADYGVNKWFVGEQWGGFGWSPQRIVEAYIRLAAACLTTTFVITQRTGACQRIRESSNLTLRDSLLSRLASGETFVTLGISHLTTSRRHSAKPAVLATQVESGWLINGATSWVTGGAVAEFIVLGAETETGEQILLAAPTSLSGIEVKHPQSLVALSSSQTAAVEFVNVLVPEQFVLAGPRENILKSGPNASTGGLQTSALAIGLASAAVAFVGQQSAVRPDLLPNADALEAQLTELKHNIIGLAQGNSTVTSDELRATANSFVLRATQSALIAAKGSGFVDDHPAGRWCRQALFFLVWSCPQGVQDANLCEFATIAE